MRLSLNKYSSPVSPLLLVTDADGALRALEFADKEARMHRFLKIHYGTYELKSGSPPAAVLRALDDYFEGQYAVLDRIRVATGGTPFQREVWRALRMIPSGSTTTYGELAARIGRRGASRAVGAANGSNPIAIVVPCHRVIGSGGKLTGYGGGLPRKQWLLEHERRT
jgi:methylated-DNA-[protein]-cysteine S-methyltransferase